MWNSVLPVRGNIEPFLEYSYLHYVVHVAVVFVFGFESMPCLRSRESDKRNRSSAFNVSLSVEFIPKTAAKAVPIPQWTIVLEGYIWDKVCSFHFTKSTMS